MTLLQRTGRMSLAVRPHLRDLVQNEERKNKLLNDLLEQHYKTLNKL